MKPEDFLSAYDSLPSSPMGDLEYGGLAEFGDLIEAGDISEMDEYVETGALKRAPFPLGFVGRSIAKFGAKGSMKGQARQVLATVKPRAAQIAASAAAARAASRNQWVTYEHIRGGRIINTTLGIGAKLRHYESEALQSQITEFPLVQPVVVSFTLAGGAGTISVDTTILNTAYGLANGVLARYIGVKLIFAASTLNRAPGGNVTITRGLGGAPTLLTSNVEIRGTNESNHTTTWTALNGGIIAGRPRFFVPLVASAAVATGLYNISVSGVPAGYTVQARLAIPGDAEFERLLRLL